MNSLTPRQNSNIHHLKLILLGIKKVKLEINISFHFNAPNNSCFQDFLLVFSLTTLANYFFHHHSKYEKIAVRVCFFFLSIFFFTMTKEVILHHRASSVPWCTLFRMQCFLFPFIDETVQLTTFALLQVFDTQFFIEIYLRWQI